MQAFLSKIENNYTTIRTKYFNKIFNKIRNRSLPKAFQVSFVK